MLPHNNQLRRMSSDEIKGSVSSSKKYIIRRILSDRHVGIRIILATLFLSLAFVLFLLGRRYASAGNSCGPVSVCLSQVGVLSKGMNGLIWVLARRLLSTSPTLCFKEIQVSTKIRVLPLELFPKISPRRIVRRTCFQLSSRMFMTLTA